MSLLGKTPYGCAPEDGYVPNSGSRSSGLVLIGMSVIIAIFTIGFAFGYSMAI